MWRHKKQASTKILVLDTWCSLDEGGVLTDPSPVPDRISLALAKHRDWVPPAAGKKAKKKAAADGADAKASGDGDGDAQARAMLPEVEALNVKGLHKLVKRLDIPLGDATRRDDILAAIVESDAGDEELKAVATAIAKE